MTNLPSTCILLPLSYHYLNEAAWLYSRIFIEDEPTTRHYALNIESFYLFAREYLQFLIQKNLSFVVLDKENQQLAGFIFAFDMTEDLTKEGEKMVAFLDHFKEGILMIDELEMRYLPSGEYHPGTTIHIFQIGITPRFRGQKIAQTMIHHLTDHARTRGFIRMIADCTHAGSEAAFEQCGFSRMGFLSYDEFRINKEQFFVELDGGISLMIREL